MSVEIHWSRLLGNKYSVKPTQEMIEAINSVGFFIRVCNVSVEGESKYKINRQDLKRIKYDEDYLNSYYRSKLGDALDLPWNDLQKLIKKARDARKKKSLPK